jgi:hypothetical protein
MHPAQRWLTLMPSAISSLCFSLIAPSAIAPPAMAAKPCIVVDWLLRKGASCWLMDCVRVG